MSKSSGRTIEISVPEWAAENLQGVSQQEMDILFNRAMQFLTLEERQTEAGLRKWMAISLWMAATLVLGVSIFLVIGQAFEISRLPDNTVTALVVSVAAEFVGMFYVVVRYLFPHGRGKESPARIE